MWDNGRSHGVACRVLCPGLSPWDLGECSFSVRDPEQLPYRVMVRCVGYCVEEDFCHVQVFSLPSFSPASK